MIAAGGVVAPHAGSSEGFIGKWQKQKTWKDPRYLFAVGFGSDVNGFSVQGGPRQGSAMAYPFTGFGGARFDKQRSGDKVYDFNVHGVAHYGLYPDWLEDLEAQAGSAIIDDMANAAEAYLQMWERAIGIAPSACRADVADLNASNLARLRPGMSPEEAIRALGQPKARNAATLEFCVSAGRIARVSFDDGALAGVTLS